MGRPIKLDSWAAACEITLHWGSKDRQASKAVFTAQDISNIRQSERKSQTREARIKDGWENTGR